MKIGIDARMYSTSFTGIGRYVAEHINELAKIDNTNDYAVFLNEPEFSQFIPPGKNFKKVLCDIPHYSLKEQTLYPKIIKNEKIDLMHFTHFNVPILYNAPFIVTIHDLTLSFFPGKKMTSLIHRLAYKITIWHAINKAKKVIAVSNNTKKDIQKLFKIEEDKIETIYEGVPKNFKETIDKSVLKKLGIKKPYLMYSGVWRDHKNIVGLLKAFKLLINKMGEDLNLVITGKENPHYPEVKNTIKELQLEKNVILSGYVNDDDLIKLISMAEAYVFPSFYEGFGLPILEAFACKTPVIASNTSSIPEVAGKGNAVYFDPYDSKEMANTIKSLINDKDKKEELVERGLKRVKDFSWRKMTKSIHRLYLENINS